MNIDPGESEIEQDFGTVSLRLNPWGTAETLYAKRIDPARASLMNVPLPESRLSVERLLAQWVEDGPGRRVDAIELAQEELQEPEDGSVWWREPDPA